MTMVSPQPESSQSRSQDMASVAESSGSPEKDAVTIAEKDDDEAERTKNKEGVPLTEKDAIALEQEEDEWKHDPANPLTWASRKKWRMTAIVCSPFQPFSWCCLLMLYTLGVSLHLRPTFSKFYDGSRSSRYCGTFWYYE